MKLKLSDQVISPEDLKELIEELRNYSQWLNHNSIVKKLTKKSAVNQPQLSEELTDLISQWQDGKEVTATSLSKLIITLTKLLDTTPKLRITLAALPSQSLKKTLVNWCRQSISPFILIDFRYNQALLGGMVVKSNSHIYDWSYRRQILDSKHLLKEVLSRV